MAKITKIKIKAPEEQEEIIVDEREFIVKEVEIKDGKPIYGYLKLKGIGKDRHIKVDGPEIVHEDMITALSELGAHLALIDDQWKPSKVKRKDATFSEFSTDEVVDLYHVKGFIIKGKIDDEKVQLLGSKHVNVGGRIDLKTPYINLSNPHYRFYNELQLSLDKVIREVELYEVEGKCTPDESGEENPNQAKIQFDQPNDNTNSGDAADADEQLNAAKV